MLRFAVGLKAKAAVAVVPQKPKNEIFGVNDPFGNISKLCSRTIHDGTDSLFAFKFDGNRPPGSGETMRYFGDKSLQNAFLSAPFCAS